MNILLVDGADDLEERVAAWLPADSSGEWTITQVHRLNQAVRLLRERSTRRGKLRLPDVAILNLSLPDSGGPLGITRLADVAPGLPIIALTTRLSARHSSDARRLGAIDCFQRDALDEMAFRSSLAKALPDQAEALFAGVDLAPATAERRAPAQTPQKHPRPEEADDSDWDSDYSYEVSLEGLVQVWSASAKDTYGLAGADAVGQHLRTLFPDDQQDEADSLLEPLRSGNPILGAEGRRHTEGGSITVLFSAFPVYDAVGSPTGFRFVERIVPATEPDLEPDLEEVEQASAKQETFVTPHADPVEDAEQAPSETESGAKPLVLIVEDNDVSRHMLKRMLEQEYRVEVASTPAEAITLATQQVFDALLLDINLQERRTGVEILHALRKVRTYQNVPAIACTSYASPGLSDRLIELGFNGYVSKPFARQTLLDALRSALDDSPAEVETGIGSEQPDLELPPAPSSLPDVMDMLSNRDGADIERLTSVLERDPVLASWVLQHVNSAFYSLRGNVGSVERAATLLGFEPICNLVLSKLVSRTFSKFDAGLPAKVNEYLQRTSVATAAYARALAIHLSMPEPDLSFSSGLLHQLGRMGLLSLEPEKYSSLWFATEDEEGVAPMPPTVGQELLNLGTDHEALGVQIAREWRLPTKLAFVIQRYEKPISRAQTPEALMALTVSAGAAASRSLYGASTPTDAETHRGPSLDEVVTALARHYKRPAADLKDFLRSRDAEVRELVGMFVVG